MIILITGSRTWTDVDRINEAILEQVGARPASEIIIMHGACPSGADAIAASLADRHGFIPEPHPADWERLGLGAGFIRNQEMVDIGADVCLAFWDGRSKGTRDCMDRADKAQMPVILYLDNNPQKPAAPREVKGL